MKLLPIYLLVLSTFFSCSFFEFDLKNTINDNQRYPSSLKLKDRGNNFDYDPGPPIETNWANLFAETPNYRAFGDKVLGGKKEKFRWIFGPMWYRGRLKKNEVKVFIVGQEGAQDENVTNRSFTGSTGTRMQKFLRYLGINRQYLYMNTFVYTITGQYTLFGDDRKKDYKVEQTKKVRWLAQNPDSIIVQHRHKMFDEVLRLNKNKLKVVIGVGTAGKDSIVTWIKENGGRCSISKLSKKLCEGSGKLKGIFFIGVRHPGSASARNAGSSASGGLRADFQLKADLIKNLIKDNRIDFPVDHGSKRDFSKPFKYGYASIPHQDFAFGTNWKMGSWSTTSNRRNADTIQVFSGGGCYNNKQFKTKEELITLKASPEILKKAGKCLNKTQVNCLDYKLSKKNPACPEIAKSLYKTFINLKYSKPHTLLRRPPAEMVKGDVPYESPKSKRGRKQFDPGPPIDYAKLLVDQFNIDFETLGVTSSIDFGPSGLYRGRFKNIKVLILSDQLSYDDMFSGRALTGTQGQQLQNFLSSIGLTKSYLILRTLPVDTMDLSLKDRIKITYNNNVKEKRERIIEKVLKENKIQLIISVGALAYRAARKFTALNKGIKLITLTSHYKNQTLTKKDLNLWKKRLETIKEMKLKLDKVGKFNFNGQLSIIPRIDLPAGTRWWLGTSGSRVARGYRIIMGKKVYSSNYYKIFAPSWVKNWKALTNPLTKQEKKSAALIKDVWLDYKY